MPRSFGFRDAYIALYNVGSIAAWSYLLYLAYAHYAAFTFDIVAAGPSLYSAVEGPLKIVQSAAFVEVLHAATGLVPSNPFTTFLQSAFLHYLRHRRLRKVSQQSSQCSIPVFLTPSPSPPASQCLVG